MQMELVDDRTAKIKVIGVGGAGGNAVNRMVDSGFEGVEFIAINTDAQALEHSKADVKIHIGKSTTKGLGAGANPNRALEAIREDRTEVEAALAGADMVFITAGMGGGTGTGAAPVVAEICKELGILSVAVVTRPFPFEGPVRNRNSSSGIEGINRNIDTLITIANEKILGIADKKMSFKEAFAFCDGVLTNAVRGISDIILNHGEIQVDFADVKAIMQAGGQALMGTGYAEGDNRAVEAAQKAIKSPLLDDIDIAGASGILVHICAGGDLGIHEMNDAMSFIYEAVGEENSPNIIFGVSEKNDMGPGMSITVIATGFGEKKAEPILEIPEAYQPKIQEPAATVENAATLQTPVIQSPTPSTPAFEQPRVNVEVLSSAPENFEKTEPLEQVRQREEALSVPAYQRTARVSAEEFEEQVFTSPRQTSEYLQNHIEGDVYPSVAKPASRTQANEYTSNDEQDYEVPAFLRNLNL